ncbi:cupin domain-containing protein [Zobellella maritima]|uniref:cupin domain-containing protein n=1 Tax=Zobellella maritima TaxID=2059725 RepID=UPI000E302B6D|nr:cupin domain-containing protein [Zobellella maritima]
MLNMDFSQTLSLPYDTQRWQASPAAGVWRYPLEREQAESGHVTSLVRFEPGAQFPTHDHPQGEEFWVLEGVFSDENGNYPAGSYVRHPPLSHHSAFSRDGCLIFVKLNQFAADDTHSLVTTAPDDGQWVNGEHGYLRLPLHRHGGEVTSVLSFPDGGRFPPCCYRHGLEILVLGGELRAGQDGFNGLSWLRFPPGTVPELVAGPGTRLWVRTGHLTVSIGGIVRTSRR